MDQWLSKFSQSFGLDWYWSIECSSLQWETPNLEKCEQSSGKEGQPKEEVLGRTALQILPDVQQMPGVAIPP